MYDKDVYEGSRFDSNKTLFDNNSESLSTITIVLA